MHTRFRHSAASISFALVVVGAVLLTATASAAPRFRTRFTGQVANASFGPSPWRIAIGDLDGDGNLDVVAPGASEGMSILMGRGDGTLASPITIGPAGGIVGFIVIADIDGDGHLDIGETSGSEAAVYFGDGTAHDWQRVGLPMDYGLQLVACDVDGDGHMDLVTLMRTNDGSPNQVRSYLSRPGRTFEVVSDPQPLLALHPATIEARDLNGDGKADLVVTGHFGNGGVYVGLGHGDGTFTFRDGLAAFGDANGCEVADATGDGKPDLIVAGSNGLVIYPGVGDGSFAAPEYINQDGWYENDLDVALADVTGDGTSDLVTSDKTHDAITVRSGLGGGTFGPPQRTFLGCALAPMKLADMNGDGMLDAVGLATTDFGGSIPPGVLIALGTCGGGFGDDRPSHPNGGSAACATGDFDGDGRPDIAVVMWQYPVSIAQVLRNVGPRQFIPQPTTSLSDEVGAVFAADLDEDGRLDLVTDGGNGEWLRGLGDGTFAPPTPLSTGGYPILAVRDVTEDGHADLVLGPSSGGLRILPGLGDGTLGPPFDLQLPSFTPGRVVAGDVDGDRHPDLVVDGSYASFIPRLMILHGPFFPGMPLVHEDWTYPAFTVSALGDVDGDGRIDLVDLVSSGNPSDQLGSTAETRLRQPDGTLGSPIVSSWPSVATSDLKLVDLDHDGHLDLLGFGDGGWYVGMGDGTGRFAIEGLEASGAGLFYPGAPDPVDFDGDGRLDLIVNEDEAEVPGLEICFGRDPVPPTVTNVVPQSGVPARVGQPTTLSWNASDDVGLGAASAFVSRHGRAGPFEPIGTAPASGGTLTWTVTGPPSDSVIYRVVVHDLDGNTAWANSAAVGVVLPATAVATAPTPARLRLAARVNPVRDHLSLALEMPHAGHTTLTLVDVAGRGVATLLDADLPAGVTPVECSLPRAARSGLYFARLDCRGQHAVARITVTR